MKIEESLLKIYEYLSNVSKQYSARILTEEELSKISINHYYYLQAIYDTINPTFSDLANQLNVSKPAVTIMVNKLIKQGYAYKTQSEEDRRVFYLYLTEKGKKIIETDLSAYKDFAKDIEGYLDKNEVENLCAIMDKIVSKINK